MNYLTPSEYQLYGLDATTVPALVGAASALIDAHCRRATLGIAQYEERIRTMPDRSTVRLTYLPLAALVPASSPIVSLRGRYGPNRRGESAADEIRIDAARAFGLPGSWTDIDAASVDFDPVTGELTFAPTVIGLGFSEVDVVYTAGFSTIPDAVKYACAEIVQNAAATPAINVKAGTIDRMRMEYFAPDLLDAGARSLLAPFVAQKAG